MAATRSTGFGQVSVGKKVLLFAGVALVIGFIYFRVAYSKLSDDVQKEKQTLRQNQQKNREIDDKIPKFKLLRAKKQVLDLTIAELQKALPTEAEVPAFFETLERRITESGVEVIKWNKR